ncbi:unnamed protein product [Adineta ricciae]|uniref:G-protein coupled receptors family 1 profile domain-containing protein n=1 Tax=Adineta ricciae TaxID=249248 RepID=A0A813TPP1_ADIRI|nr:unnamed protein product [Adineta ricciae]
MSSSFALSSFTIALLQTQRYLFQYGGPIIITLGLIGCILCWLVFSKATLRKSPCSIYMIAFQIFNITYIITIILPSVLSFGYNVSYITNTLGLCRFSMYMTYVLDVLNPSCLILASIDRILITSQNTLTRQRSTSRLAYISIIYVTLFCFVLHIHTLMLMNVVKFGTNFLLCFSLSFTYLTVLNYYMLVKSIIIPSIMTGLGILAIRNVRKLNYKRIAPQSSGINFVNHRNLQAVHAKDRQLVRIILIDIGIYVLCTYPLTASRLYQQITQYDMKTYDKILAKFSIQYICVFFSYIPYCIGLYSKLIVSKTFRKEVKNIFLCK